MLQIAPTLRTTLSIRTDTFFAPRIGRLRAVWASLLAAWMLSTCLIALAPHDHDSAGGSLETASSCPICTWHASDCDIPVSAISVGFAAPMLVSPIHVVVSERRTSATITRRTKPRAPPA